MTALLQLLARHKGKASVGGVLAVVAFLLSRGCDVTVHVDPVKAREETNAPAEVSPK
jgi:hypothetical protein